MGVCSPLAIPTTREPTALYLLPGSHVSSARGRCGKRSWGLWPLSRSQCSEQSEKKSGPGGQQAEPGTGRAPWTQLWLSTSYGVKTQITQTVGSQRKEKVMHPDSQVLRAEEAASSQTLWL